MLIQRHTYFAMAFLTFFFLLHFFFSQKSFISHITYSLQVKCCCSQQLQFISHILLSLLSNSKETNLLINQ